MNKYVGNHAIYDLEFATNSKILKSKKDMIGIMRKACLQVGATILEEHIHKFQGGGFTFTLILAESHASAHTWPEYGLATVDIFMCGDCDAWIAMDTFVKLLKCNGYQPDKYTQTKISRGWVETKNPDP